MRRAKCGGCGCATATVRLPESEAPQRIELTCTQCKARTVFGVAPPRLQVMMLELTGDEADGTFCVGWFDDPEGA